MKLCCCPPKAASLTLPTMASKREGGVAREAAKCTKGSPWGPFSPNGEPTLMAGTSVPSKRRVARAKSLDTKAATKGLVVVGCRGCGVEVGEEVALLALPTPPPGEVLLLLLPALAPP